MKVTDERKKEIVTEFTKDINNYNPFFVAFLIIIFSIGTFVGGIFAERYYFSKNIKKIVENDDVIVTTTTKVKEYIIDNDKINNYLNYLADFKYDTNYNVSELDNTDKLKLVSYFINYEETHTLNLFNKKVSTLIKSEVSPGDIYDSICDTALFIYNAEEKKFESNSKHAGHGGLERTIKNKIIDSSIENNIVTVTVKKVVLTGLPYDTAYIDIENKNELTNVNNKKETIKFGTCDSSKCITDENAEEIFNKYGDKLQSHIYKFEIDENDNYLLLSHEVK